MPRYHYKNKAEQGDSMESGEGALHREDTPDKTIEGKNKSKTNQINGTGTTQQQAYRIYSENEDDRRDN